MSYQAAVITVSDRASAGVYEDKSGPAVAAMLKEAGYEVVYTSIVPDEQEKISEELISCVDEKHCDLVITSGGTGLSPRDVTPEATRAVLEREIPAIPQAMIYYSLQITPRAMLSRAVAGTRRNSLILNLPGSEKAARCCAVFFSGVLSAAFCLSFLPISYSLSSSLGGSSFLPNIRVRLSAK